MAQLDGGVPGTFPLWCPTHCMAINQRRKAETIDACWSIQSMHSMSTFAFLHSLASFFWLLLPIQDYPSTFSAQSAGEFWVGMAWPCTKAPHEALPEALPWLVQLQMHRNLQGSVTRQGGCWKSWLPDIAGLNAMPNLKQPQNITKQVMKRKIKKRNEIREASLSLYIMRILRSLDDLTRMTDSITNKKVLACTTKLVQTTSIIFYQ